MKQNKMSKLPRDKMKECIIAVDIDRTLITKEEPHELYLDIYILIKILSRFKNVKIVAWSGSGIDHAEKWINKLGLQEHIWKIESKYNYNQIKPTIVIDDVQDTSLGEVNLIVNREE